MKHANETCDAIQERLSAAIDDCADLPEELLDHMAKCPDCSSFLDTWNELEPVLSQPLPPAGIELRNRVLARATSSNQSVGTRTLWKTTSAAAAVTLIGICTYALLKPTPNPKVAHAPPPIEEPIVSKVASTEVENLKSDLEASLITLRGPVRSIQNVLTP